MIGGVSLCVAFKGLASETKHLSSSKIVKGRVLIQFSFTPGGNNMHSSWRTRRLCIIAMYSNALETITSATQPNQQADMHSSCANKDDIPDIFLTCPVSLPVGCRFKLVFRACLGQVWVGLGGLPCGIGVGSGLV